STTCGRQRAKTETGIVRAPRHIVVYRFTLNDDVVTVLRVLHDSMDVTSDSKCIEFGIFG
ncbi:MAG: type II toxin-antitoxin system RelE/ParE family toxin, partial [Pseudolabrys sp.]